MWVVFLEDKPTKTLIVKNLSFDVTKESLEEEFPDSTRIGLPKHYDTGKPKG